MTKEPATKENKLATLESKCEVFTTLTDKCKSKKKGLKHTLIEPYKKDIYRLRFEKYLSYAEIGKLFEEIEEKVSKNAVARFCREAFPQEYQRYLKRTKKPKPLKAEKQKKEKKEKKEKKANPVVEEEKKANPVIAEAVK